MAVSFPASATCACARATKTKPWAYRRRPSSPRRYESQVTWLPRIWKGKVPEAERVFRWVPRRGRCVPRKWPGPDRDPATGSGRRAPGIRARRRARPRPRRGAIEPGIHRQEWPVTSARQDVLRGLPGEGAAGAVCAAHPTGPGGSGYHALADASCACRCFDTGSRRRPSPNSRRALQPDAQLDAAADRATMPSKKSYGAAAHAFQDAFNACPSLPRSCWRPPAPHCRAGTSRWPSRAARQFLIGSLAPWRANSRSPTSISWPTAAEALQWAEDALKRTRTPAALKLKGTSDLFGRHSDAMDTSSCCSTAPGRRRRRLLLGRIYYQEGRIDYAIGQFQSRLEAGPKSYKAS